MSKFSTPPANNEKTGYRIKGWPLLLVLLIGCNQSGSGSDATPGPDSVPADSNQMSDEPDNAAKQGNVDESEATAESSLTGELSGEGSPSASDETTPAASDEALASDEPTPVGFPGEIFQSLDDVTTCDLSRLDALGCSEQVTTELSLVGNPVSNPEFYRGFDDAPLLIVAAATSGETQPSTTYLRLDGDTWTDPTIPLAGIDRYEYAGREYHIVNSVTPGPRLTAECVVLSDEQHDIMRGHLYGGHTHCGYVVFMDEGFIATVAAPAGDIAGFTGEADWYHQHFVEGPDLMGAYVYRRGRQATDASPRVEELEIAFLTPSNTFQEPTQLSANAASGSDAVYFYDDTSLIVVWAEEEPSGDGWMDNTGTLFARRYSLDRGWGATEVVLQPGELLGTGFAWMTAEPTEEGLASLTFRDALATSNRCFQLSETASGWGTPEELPCETTANDDATTLADPETPTWSLSTISDREVPVLEARFGEVTAELAEVPYGAMPTDVQLDNGDLLVAWYHFDEALRYESCDSGDWQHERAFRIRAGRVTPSGEVTELRVPIEPFLGTERCIVPSGS